MLFAYVGMCAGRLMWDHLEESDFGSTIFHAEWTWAWLESLEKVKMEEGRQEAEIQSHYSRDNLCLCDLNKDCIKFAFSLTNHQSTDSFGCQCYLDS